MRSRLAFVFAVFLHGQEPGFEVQSRLVVVPAIVTDGKGRHIDGLTASDFVVLDNGRPQPVLVDEFSSMQAPIALIIAVQSSGISEAALEKVRKIGSMIQPLITGERGCAGLVSFDQRVQWHQDCTASADLLLRAFQQLQPGDDKSGRMLDAVYEAVARLRRRPNVRRVLLLVSESRDRGSETELESVLVNAQAAGVTVYAATYSAIRIAFTSKPSPAEIPPPSQQPRSTRTEPLGPKGRVPIPPAEQRVDLLAGIGELARLGKTRTTEVLTRNTGGATFSFTRQKGLETAIENLGAELHSQYLLSFTPEDPQPGYHRLEVRLADKPKLQVRARPAYWSVR